MQTPQEDVDISLDFSKRKKRIKTKGVPKRFAKDRFLKFIEHTQDLIVGRSPYKVRLRSRSASRASSTGEAPVSLTTTKGISRKKGWLHRGQRKDNKMGRRLGDSVEVPGLKTSFYACEYDLTARCRSKE